MAMRYSAALDYKTPLAAFAIISNLGRSDRGGITSMKAWAVLAVFLVGSLLLAACGGGDTPTPNPTPTPTVKADESILSPDEAIAIVKQYLSLKQYEFFDAIWGSGVRPCLVPYQNSPFHAAYLGQGRWIVTAGDPAKLGKTFEGIPVFESYQAAGQWTLFEKTRVVIPSEYHPNC